MSNRIPIEQQISKNPKVMAFGHNEEAKIVRHDGSKLLCRILGTFARGLQIPKQMLKPVKQENLEIRPV